MIITNLPAQGGAKLDSLLSPNLLTGTADFSGTGWMLSGTVETETFNDLTVRGLNFAWPKLYKTIEASEGEVYTFSFFLKSPVSANFSIYTNAVNDGAGTTDAHGKFSFTATNEWKRYSCIAHVLTAGILWFRPETSTAQQIYVCGYKLERGENTETVWTPAPEDYKSIFDRLTALEEAAKQSTP